MTESKERRRKPPREGRGGGEQPVNMVARYIILSLY